MEIQGRTFLVTGAGSGLGAACARRLVATGGRVVVADVQSAAGEAIASELGDAARFAHVDVRQPDGVSRAIELAQTSFGPLRGVVHCAGILAAGRIVGRDGPHDLAAFARVVEVNLVGTFNVLRLAAAAMAANEPEDEGERGVIINTASIAAFEGQIGQAAYAASKAGVAALTLPAARELGRLGIRVVAIAPGVFETPMMAQAPPDVRQSLASQIPYPSRFGKPEEFAALAEHILTNRLINGEVIRLDGALRMAAK